MGAKVDDTFFDQNKCDRCSCLLNGVRTMSWFTEDCLCEACSKLEDSIKKGMKIAGLDPSNYEGCGYVPNEYLSGVEI